jgi:hypothetical protein
VDTAAFTDQEIRKLAVLINCFTAIGGELLDRRTGALQQAYTNLQKFKRENKELLEKAHSQALNCNAVSALRLSEDLERLRPSVSDLMQLVQRCLSASTFLSHCIAATGKPKPSAVMEQAAEQQRLH